MQCKSFCYCNDYVEFDVPRKAVHSSPDKLVSKQTVQLEYANGSCLIVKRVCLGSIMCNQSTGRSVTERGNFSATVATWFDALTPGDVRCVTGGVSNNDWKRPRRQEAQLSPRDRAMRRVNWNLANCHATVQKLLIRQVLTKLMVWSWRFSRRQCVIDNVHSTRTRPSRLSLSQVS